MPVETPGFLTIIIAIIETVRRVIHPVTLAARLAANIVASHLLPTLLGLQTPLPLINLVLLIVELIILLVLELLVAYVKSCVFTILNPLYLNEFVRLSFNKLI